MLSRRTWHLGPTNLPRPARRNLMTTRLRFPRIATATVEQKPEPAAPRAKGVASLLPPKPAAVEQTPPEPRGKGAAAWGLETKIDAKPMTDSAASLLTNVGATKVCAMLREQGVLWSVVRDILSNNC